MNWHDLAATVADAAPTIGHVLAGPAGETAGSVLASVFGSADNPDAVNDAIANDPKAAAKLKQAEMDHAQEMRSLAIKARSQELDAQTTQQGNVNETMRAEMQATGLFKAGWRSFLGWIFGVCVLLIAIALSASVIIDPSQIVEAVKGMIALLVTVAPVIGVNIAGNRRERETAMTGQPSTGLIDALSNRIKPRAP